MLPAAHGAPQASSQVHPGQCRVLGLECRRRKERKVTKQFITRPSSTAAAIKTTIMQHLQDHHHNQLEFNYYKTSNNSTAKIILFKTISSTNSHRTHQQWQTATHQDGKHPNFHLTWMTKHQNGRNFTPEP